MTDEEWRPIAGWEGFYSVSSCGRVRSEDRYVQYKDGRKPRLWRGKILAQSLDSDGYSCVGLHRSGKTQNGKVHRLVAAAFIPQQEGKTQINHLNEIKTDNHVKNLEWCTVAENNAYGTHNVRAGEHHKVPVNQYTADGAFIATYGSQIEAAKATGVSQGNIALCCKGERGHFLAGGFHWEYAAKKEARKC